VIISKQITCLTFDKSVYKTSLSKLKEYILCTGWRYQVVQTSKAVRQIQQNTWLMNWLSCLHRRLYTTHTHTHTSQSAHQNGLLHHNTWCHKNNKTIWFFCHNYGKGTPIFYILSLLDCQGNFVCVSATKSFHLTSTVLLHCLVNLEKYKCDRFNGILRARLLTLLLHCSTFTARN